MIVLAGVLVFFQAATLLSVVSFGADMANGTAGQIAKGLRRIMACAAVFIVELLQVFPFVSGSKTGLFSSFDGTLFHGEDFLMAGLTCNFSLL
ncbi:MAG: hypothetical protein FD168_1982 [Desulfobulbaceae bacterium]|nr:MAG: hypothetical protein FD168_1982 [Desulfobulbaceae bacterium]